MFVAQHKNLFALLNEAEDDQTTEAPATDAGTEEAPAP